MNITYTIIYDVMVYYFTFFSQRTSTSGFNMCMVPWHYVIHSLLFSKSPWRSMAFDSLDFLNSKLRKMSLIHFDCYRLHTEFILLPDADTSNAPKSRICSSKDPLFFVGVADVATCSTIYIYMLLQNEVSSVQFRWDRPTGCFMTN